jgi:spore maturation protein CgeB
MNSACVPVANRRIGSAPYLIKRGENGFIYSSEDELYEKVRYLLDHEKERNEMARRAYTTIINEWNAEVAAERLLLLSDRILSGEEYDDVDTGICSRI